MPARVLAGGAGLAAEAGREAGVAQRQRAGRRGSAPACRAASGDLRGADEEEVVLGDLVDLLAVVGEEAGPEQRLLADQDRRDHRLVALAAQPAPSRSGPAPARAAPGRPSGRRSASRRASPPTPCRSGRARCRSRGGRAARSRTRAARRPRARRPRPPRSSRRGRRGRAGWGGSRRLGRGRRRPPPARPRPT